jgi:putative membrane protein
MDSTQLCIAALATSLSVGAAAQTRSATPPAQNQTIVTAEAARAAPSASTEDVEFLNEALRSAQAEIELGKLAAERGHDARVRDLGARVEREHTAQLTELEGLLKGRHVVVSEEPSADAQLQVAALKRLTGAEFDAAFLELMAEMHRKALEQYGAETHANPDEVLSDFASKHLPVLREHLRIAESLR